MRTRRKNGLQQRPSIASRIERPKGRNDNQYCSEGKVVTYFRWVVQLQMLCTRQPSFMFSVMSASGTQSSDGDAGHGGMRTEQRHEITISSAARRNCDFAESIFELKSGSFTLGHGIAAMRCGNTQS